MSKPLLYLPPVSAGHGYTFTPLTPYSLNSSAEAAREMLNSLVSRIGSLGFRIMDSGAQVRAINSSFASLYDLNSLQARLDDS
jgi:hypothetical protein